MWYCSRGLAIATNNYRFTGEFWLLGTIQTSRKDGWHYRNSLQYWYQKIDYGMLPCIVLLLPIFDRGSIGFSGYQRDIYFSLFPWLTYSQTVGGSGLHPKGEVALKHTCRAVSLPHFPRLCNSCCSTVSFLSQTPSTFWEGMLLAGKKMREALVSPSCM